MRRVYHYRTNTDTQRTAVHGPLLLYNILTNHPAAVTNSVVRAEVGRTRNAMNAQPADSSYECVCVYGYSVLQPSGQVSSWTYSAQQLSFPDCARTVFYTETDGMKKTAARLISDGQEQLIIRQAMPRRLHPVQLRTDIYPGFVQGLVSSSDILFACTSPIPPPIYEYITSVRQNTVWGACVRK